MKKVNLFALLAIVVSSFSACQEDELMKSSGKESTLASLETEQDVYLENDYLVFKDLASLDSVAKLLCNADLTTQLAWEQPLNFVSAKTYRAQVNDKLLNEDNPVKAERYIHELAEEGYFSMTDSAMTYPFYRMSWACVLNPDGLVKIGGALYSFSKLAQVTALDGKKETLSRYFKGELGAEDTLVMINSYLKTRTSGYYFGESLAAASRQTSDRRLTIKLIYDAVAYYNPEIIGNNRVDQAYYEFYFHQESKKIIGWGDKHTHFYIYPAMIQFNNLYNIIYDHAWSIPLSETWHMLNTSELANYYLRLWEGQIPDMSESGAFIGPEVVLDCFFYSGEVGSESNTLEMDIPCEMCY